MGPNPSGYLIYGADGRMMAIFVPSGRKGTYAVQGDTIVHHVDVSWNDSWIGTD